jgi:hypothetical protein
MAAPISIASPHPAYLIFAQYQPTPQRWVYRVFGPRAGLIETFATPSDAFAFVRDSADMPEASPGIAAPVR